VAPTDQAPPEQAPQSGTCAHPTLRLTGLHVHGPHLGEWSVPCRGDSFFPCLCAERDAARHPSPRGTRRPPSRHGERELVVVRGLVVADRRGYRLRDGRLLNFESLDDSAPSEECWGIVRDAHEEDADGVLLAYEDARINVAVFPYRADQRIEAIDGDERCSTCGTHLP